MAIQGSLEEAGLPDVLQLLALGRKSGCLTVVDGEMRGEIFLDVGRVSFATVVNRRDRLGDLLVKSGRITREQLAVATEEQERGNKKQLGLILVDSGRISRGSLEKVVRLQVEEAVYSLFTWKRGEFTYSSNRLPPHHSLLVSLDPEGLLLEGARRVDEWSQIQKKVPSLDLVFRLSRQRLGAATSDLTDEQKRILPLLDGTRDVAGVVDVTGLTEFDVGKALFGLVTAGLATLVERRARVRHLDYREVLAYVVREAEFADPQRRKEAARHIVDCPMCADRLRGIHVRQTGASVAATGTEAERVTAPAPRVERVTAPAPRVERVTAPAPEPEVAAPVAAASDETPMVAAPRRTFSRRPTVPPRVTDAAAAETRRLAERRRGDRRTGQDRRYSERRCLSDRRQAGSSSWPETHDERRLRLRRDSDRRPGTSRERRSGDMDRRTAAYEMSTTVARQPGAGTRTTEARQLKSLEPRGPDGLLHEEPDNWASESPAPAAATGQDLAWIVSPRESIEMIRASRPMPRITKDDITEDDITEEEIRAVREARRQSAAVRRTTIPAMAAPPVRAADAPSSQPAPSRDAGVMAQAGRMAGKALRQRRQLAIAAGIIGVIALSYAAGQMGRGNAADAVLETAAAPAETATEAAQAAPASPPLRASAETAALRAEPPPAAQPAPPAVGTIRGVVRDQSGRPVSGARVLLRGTTLTAVTGATGSFELTEVPVGPGVIQAAADGFNPGSTNVRTSTRGATRANVTLVPRPVVTAATPPAQTPATPGQAAPSPQAAAPAQAQPAPAALTPPPVAPAQPPAAQPAPTAAQPAPAAAAPAPAAAAPAPAQPASAREPDRELAAGGWAPLDRAEATSLLGGTLGAIEGLGIESIARSTTGSRPRVRVTQVAPTGERITLTETLAGAAARGAGPARVTSLRVTPPSEAYPLSTGTVSFGSLLITVRSSLAAEPLRALLERLADAGR